MLLLAPSSRRNRVGRRSLAANEDPNGVESEGDSRLDSAGVAHGDALEDPVSPALGHDVSPDMEGDPDLEDDPDGKSSGALTTSEGGVGGSELMASVIMAIGILSESSSAVEAAGPGLWAPLGVVVREGTAQLRRACGPARPAGGDLGRCRLAMGDVDGCRLAKGDVDGCTLAAGDPARGELGRCKPASCMRIRCARSASLAAAAAETKPAAANDVRELLSFPQCSSGTFTGVAACIPGDAGDARRRAYRTGGVTCGRTSRVVAVEPTPSTALVGELRPRSVGCVRDQLWRQPGLGSPGGSH